MTSRKFLIGIHDIHGDETRILKDVLAPFAREYLVWEGCKGVDKDMLLQCDVCVYPSTELLSEMALKPFIVIIVNSGKMELIRDAISRLPTFRGVASTSSVCYDTFKRCHIPAAYVQRRYEVPKHILKCSMEREAPPRQCVSIINCYERISNENRLPCFADFCNISEIVATKSKRYSLKLYGLESANGVMHDWDALKSARYLIHLKHWGHVCNAVVKALACGVPVIMDRATFEIGAYGGYIRNGENALVMEDAGDIAAYLTCDTEREEGVFLKLSETCLSEMHKYHLPYPTDESNSVARLMADA